MDDTRCGRCGTGIFGPERETVSAVRWVPDSEDPDGGHNELINMFCMRCWRIIMAAMPPAAVP